MIDIVEISKECSAEFYNQRIYGQLRSGYWDHEIFSYESGLSGSVGSLDFLLCEDYCVLLHSPPC